MKRKPVKKVPSELEKKLAFEDRQKVVSEARKRGKYQSKACLLDAFFSIKRQIEFEPEGLKVSLQKVSRIDDLTLVKSFGYVVDVAGFSSRFESIPECTAFLSGFHLAFVFSKRPESLFNHPAFVGSGEKVLKVMG